MTSPKLVVLLSEVWTMTDPRDLRGLVALAVAAEEAGVDGIEIGEHVLLGPNSAINGLPDNPREPLGIGMQEAGYPHPNGLHLLSAVAAVTSRVRLIAGAVLSPLRHPLVLGKELATVDLISRGRLVYLPAVGWQEEEYEAVGVPFHQRGKILDEQLEVWERIWRDEPVSYHGKHFRFQDISFAPKPWRPTGPPVWIGGMRLYPNALRRVVRHAQGYFPLGPLSPDDVGQLREALEANGRTLDELELVGAVGMATPFPDATSTKALGPALDEALPQMANGFSTFVIKPNMYIDDRDQLGDLCRDAVAGLRERAIDVGAGARS